MAKLPRITAKVFASNAAETDIGQFGSALSGTKVATSDVSQIQALPVYEQGWKAAVISNRNYPTLQEMNGLQKTFSQQIAYTLQEGVPEYDAGTSYYIGSWCKGVDADGNRNIYESLTDDNIGNALTDDTKWKKVTIGGGGSGGGGAGSNMFDTVIKDHILSFEESKGLALQGTYVYKTAVAGSRYGYPDFYNKCLEEYKNPDNTKISIKNNVNITGSLTNNNGVLSGFSDTAYCQTPSTLDLTDKTWEIGFKIRTASAMTVYNDYAGQKQGLALGINNNTNHFNLAFSTNASTPWTMSKEGTHNVLPSTDYWLRAKYDGSTYTLEYSLDGENFTTDITLNGAGYKPSTQTFQIGKYSTSSNAYFEGSIDLKESYINIDGSRWWDGAYLVYKNPNGHIFYDISQKDQIDEIFANTGTAWYYGIDTQNERIFLPRNNNFVQTSVDSADVNDFTEAGLPNITGSVVLHRSSDPTGAFYKTNDYIGDSGGQQINTNNYKYGFNASRSSAVYGKSDTVQPAALKQLLYIVVGNTEVTSSVTDVVDITTTENDTIPLFTAHYFEFAPNHPSWLKAGGQANNAGLYTTAYNKLVNALTDNPNNLKVVDTSNMTADVDYSEYWKVDQTNMTFTAPTKISFMPINADTVPVVGNGMALGMTNGEYEGGTIGWAYTGGWGLNVTNEAYGKDIGTVANSQIMKEKAFGITSDSTKSGMIADLSAAKSTTAQLYFKVANAVQNIEMLNVGAVTEALADKISRQDCKAYITETYVNGTSGYRVWSDGYCEQWGTGKSASTIYFLKEFKIANYFPVLTITGYTGTATMGADILTAGNRTTTSMRLGTIPNQYQGITMIWKVSGYLAEGEY